jgi:hypothetical protein
MKTLIAIAAALAWLCAPAGAASILSPLPAADYSVRSVCAASAPGRAGCLSRQLVARTAAARAHTHPLGMPRLTTWTNASPAAGGSFGLRPQDLHSAYELPAGASSSQTIALVDAYNKPGAEADLAAYSQEFGLPQCTTANGCFRKVYARGEAPFPKTTQELEAAHKGTPAEREEAQRAEGWGLEISLDIQAAHATCQNCQIMLVEASSPGYEDLEQAEEVAIALGASVISNSWGGPETGETPALESKSPFNHPGIVITASAGDNGYLGWAGENPSERGYAEFPASSPHVVAVGGTRLRLGVGGTWNGETVWNGSGAGGGGCSVNFTAQPWQQNTAGWPAVGCGSKRAIADVSANADPYTGFAVHDSGALCLGSYEAKPVHWCTLGGTSLASPIIASVYALAGGSGGSAYPAGTLYENQARLPGSLHDVVGGSNGACSKGFDEAGISNCTAAEEAAKSCESKLICLATSGYDGPTGVGTPSGIAAFQPPQEGAVKGEKGSPASESAEPAKAPAGAGSPGAGAPSGPPAAGTSAPTPAPAVQISGLTLTLRAVVALNGSRPKVGQVGFAFTINLPARVRASLAKRLRHHGSARWQALRGSLAFATAPGRNSRHLRGGGSLSAGRYQLTLTPVHGTARSIVFQIG